MESKVSICTYAYTCHVGFVFGSSLRSFYKRICDCIFNHYIGVLSCFKTREGSVKGLFNHVLKVRNSYDKENITSLACIYNTERTARSFHCSEYKAKQEFFFSCQPAPLGGQKGVEVESGYRGWW